MDIMMRQLVARVWGMQRMTTAVSSEWLFLCNQVVGNSGFVFVRTACPTVLPKPVRYASVRYISLMMISNWLLCVSQQNRSSVQDMVSWAALPPTHHKHKPVHPGPWLLCFPTSVSQGVRRSCCRPLTVRLTLVQPLRQDWGRASH